MRGTLNIWLWGKKTIVEDIKEERLVVATTVGDEKREEQLLMGSTKRKQ
jgi:hypothetical protein